MYITDNTKVTRLTGWSPKINPKRIIQEIHEWLRENENILKSILN